MQTARRITKCNHDSSAAFGWAVRMHTEDQTHISTFMYLYLKELVFWVICICTGQSGGVQEGIQGAENVWLAFLQGRVEHPSSARWQNLAHIMNMFFCTFPSFVFVLKCILYSLYNILAGFSYIISSVRSSNSHPDLLVIQQHHPLFQIHTVPQHWTFTFWATTAISKAITGLMCWLKVYQSGTTAR